MDFSCFEFGTVSFRRNNIRIQKFSNQQFIAWSDCKAEQVDLGCAHDKGQTVFWLQQARGKCCTFYTSGDIEKFSNRQITWILSLESFCYHLPLVFLENIKQNIISGKSVIHKIEWTLVTLFVYLVFYANFNILFAYVHVCFW
jgi:hypothetical protein